MTWLPAGQFAGKSALWKLVAALPALDRRREHGTGRRGGRAADDEPQARRERPDAGVVDDAGLVVDDLRPDRLTSWLPLYIVGIQYAGPVARAPVQVVPPAFSDAAVLAALVVRVAHERVHVRRAGQARVDDRVVGPVWLIEQLAWNSWK